MLELETYLLGLGEAAWAIAGGRIATGAFFGISGFHKLFVPQRHAQLVATLRDDGVPFVKVFQWMVPATEFLAGLALIVGFLTLPAAIALAVILCVACIVDGRKRVAAFQPINAADRIDDWLYLSEVVYLIVLVTIIMAGPGAVAIDHWLFG